MLWSLSLAEQENVTWGNLALTEKEGRKEQRKGVRKKKNGEAA